MQAKDVMTRFVVSIAPETSVTEIARVLIERSVSAVPVVDDTGEIVGIVSEGDLMRRPETGTDRRPSWWLKLLTLSENQTRDYVKSHGLRADDVMTRDVVTVAEDTPINEIADLLESRRIKRVPVVREGKPVGIVSRANLISALASTKEMPATSADDETIREALMTEFELAGVHTLYVNAIVTNGVVHIRGDANSEDERRAATVAAESIPGVLEVRNRVTVVTPTMRALYWE